MGKRSRPTPERLAAKLLHIRNALGISQNQLIVRLGLNGELPRQDISDFERGIREPPLTILLQYARTVGITVEVLIDDKLELPSRLQGNTARPQTGRAPGSR